MNFFAVDYPRGPPIAIYLNKYDLYLSSIPKRRASFSIIKLAFNVIGGRLWSILILSNSNILVTISKRCSSSCTGAGHLIKWIASLWDQIYCNFRLSNLLALGNENFCFDDELLSPWVERSSPIEFLEPLLFIDIC